MFLLELQLALQVWNTAKHPNSNHTYYRRVGRKQYDISTLHQVRTEKQIQMKEPQSCLSGLRKDTALH